MNEKKVSSAQRFYQILLTGLCLVLTYLLWIETRPMTLSHEIYERIDDVNNDIANLVFPGIENTIPNIDEFDEMINRPLFFESRRPFIEEETVDIPEQINNKSNTIKTNEQYSLNAIIITPEKKIALIQKNKNKELQRISLGENIDGWILDEVADHQVTLMKGSERKILLLEIKNSSPEKNQVVQKLNNAALATGEAQKTDRENRLPGQSRLDGDFNAEDPKQRAATERELHTQNN